MNTQPSRDSSRTRSENQGASVSHRVVAIPFSSFQTSRSAASLQLPFRFRFQLVGGHAHGHRLGGAPLRTARGEAPPGRGGVPGGWRVACRGAVGQFGGGVCRVWPKVGFFQHYIDFLCMVSPQKRRLWASSWLEMNNRRGEHVEMLWASRMTLPLDLFLGGECSGGPASNPKGVVQEFGCGLGGCHPSTSACTTLIRRTGAVFPVRSGLVLGCVPDRFVAGLGPERCTCRRTSTGGPSSSTSPTISTIGWRQARSWS